MGDYNSEKNTLKEKISQGLRNLRNQIRDDFRTNPDFRNAVIEQNNDQNDVYLIRVITFFGVMFGLTESYTITQSNSEKSLDELVEELKGKLDWIVEKYDENMRKLVDDFTSEILVQIESSEFLTEVVCNPAISYSKANKEMKKL